jgi:hypothetical protein
MRIARFTTGEDPAYGLVDGAGEKIAEITGDPLYQRIELTGAVHEVSDVRLLAPVIPRSKVIGIGKNYAEHAREMGGEAPATPLMFLVPNTAVIGPGDPVVMPPQTSEVGYEGELAVVIGRLCKDVDAERRARLRLRLHHRQRRHGARPSAQRRPVGAGQGLRHLLPARAVDRDRPRPGCPADRHHARRWRSSRTARRRTWCTTSPP